MAASPSLSPPWSLLTPLGVASLFAVGLQASDLAGPGIALVVGATALAIGLAVPLARALAVPERGAPWLTAAATEIPPLLLAATVGAVMGSFFPAAQPLTIAYFIALWAAVAGAGRVRAAMLGFVLLTLLTSTALLGQTVLQATGWTLLSPWWPSWTGWFGPVVLGALLLTGAGLTRPPPASPRRALAPVGIGALLALAVAMALSGDAEQIAPVDGSFVRILLAFGVFGAAALYAGSASRGAWRPAAVGLISSLLFVAPARDALPAFFYLLLPVGIAISLALAALTRTGSARWTLGSVATLALLVPLTSWPGLPGPLAAAALGTLPVLILWVVGTRAVLARLA